METVMPARTADRTAASMLPRTAFPRRLSALLCLLLLLAVSFYPLFGAGADTVSLRRDFTIPACFEPDVDTDGPCAAALPAAVRPAGGGVCACGRPACVRDSRRGGVALSIYHKFVGSSA